MFDNVINEIKPAVVTAGVVSICNTNMFESTLRIALLLATLYYYHLKIKKEKKNKP